MTDNELAELQATLARIEDKIDHLGRMTGEQFGGMAKLVNAVLEVALQNQMHLKSGFLAQEVATPGQKWDEEAFDPAAPISRLR
jgi:hypothetical protein